MLWGLTPRSSLALQRAYKHSPSLGFGASGVTQHHQTVAQSLDLIQLDDLLDEDLFVLPQHHLDNFHGV
jgi:hypothetical protein